MVRSILAATVFALLLTAPSCYAQIRITEWEYNGLNDGDAGEFFELMNVGNAPIDMNGWSFDDSSQAPGSFSLSGYGVVQPKEIVILTEATAAAFRTAWSLPAAIKVVGENTQNLSRADEINIYDAANQLVDRLTFGDNTGATTGSIRTNGISGNPKTIAALGVNDVFQWQRSALADIYGSHTSSGGNLGNPGVFALIPEPGTLVLLLLGIGGAALRRRAR